MTLLTTGSKSSRPLLKSQSPHAILIGMNEKFFDLKKSKQDRMINGSLKIFTENGFRKSMYSAISKKRQSNGKLIVAIKENTNQDIPFNPNYNHFDNSIIRYYEINEKEEMIKIEDNWNIFDPRKYNWFPEKFKEENHLFYDYENYEDGNNCTSGWTRQELEDAADIAYEGHSRLELGLD